MESGTSPGAEVLTGSYLGRSGDSFSLLFFILLVVTVCLKEPEIRRRT